MEQQEQDHGSGRRGLRFSRRLGVLLTAALLVTSAAGAGAAGARSASGAVDAGSANGAADAGLASRGAFRSTDATVVSTDLGAVRGRLEADARVFQGIPYAAPPEGELRWVSPQPAASWSGVRDATKPGNRCAQAKGLIDPASSSEDCLFLNVTTPRRSSGRKLPVMVWIHGNGFISGAGSLYDAQRLASTGNVIVVSFNYRLGIFGFLAHPALNHGRNLSGNFGLEDQQVALKWVKRNAAAFGGDTGNVTIFGESAGGTSVCAQLAAPGSAGLFQKAIVQSGECTGRKWSPGPPTWFPLPRAEREQNGLEVAAKIGCPDLATAAACLRGKDKHVDDLAKLSDVGVGSGPTYGGGMLPLSPERAFATGRFNRVPIMQGVTRDEHNLFTAAVETATEQQTTPATYREQLEALFTPADVERVLVRYPVSRFHSAGEALSAVVTDWAWGCTILERNRVLAAHTPLYAYEFADDTAPWFTTLPKPNFPTGAFHGAELQYLFADEQLPGPVTPSQQQLSATMMRYWAQFAATGNPNGGGQPRWQPFQSRGHVQSLAASEIGSADLAREHQCAFWNSVAS